MTTITINSSTTPTFAPTTCSCSTCSPKLPMYTISTLPPPSPFTHQQVEEWAEAYTRCMRYAQRTAWRAELRLKLKNRLNGGIE